MLIKKKPYQFWNYRDTRKSGVPKVPIIDLKNKVYTLAQTNITGFISHSILLPFKDLPEALVNRLKADLTLPNPEFLKAKKYGKGFVSYAIPSFIYLYTMDSQFLGLPRSIKLPYLFKRFQECGLTLELKDIRPELERLTWQERGIIKPLFYQEDAIKRIVEGNIIISLSCGKGKTILGTLAIARLGYRALILVRNNIILTQWIDALKRVFDVQESDIGIINGDIKREGQVTVATGQSLTNLSREEKKRIGMVYNFVLVDECHEWASRDCAELLPIFKAKYLCGLSATPERNDNLTPIIKAYIGPIVEIDDLGEINSIVHLIKTQFAYNFIGKKDKYHELLSALICDRDRNQLIIDVVKKYVKEGKNILLYSSRIQHMETLREMIKEQIPDLSIGMLASVVDGHSLSVEEQNAIRNSINDHKIQLLVTGKMAEQGFDAPVLSVAMLTTPTKSIRLIKQVRGRVMREYLGKKEAVLVDFIDEKTKILLYQFFVKNKKIYQNYRKEYEI